MELISPTEFAKETVHSVQDYSLLAGQAVANLMDISTMEGGKGLVDQAVKEFGKLDILVTHLTRFGERNPLEDLETTSNCGFLKN